MSEVVPEGWGIRQAEEIYERLKVPRVYDRNDVSSNGNFPILDQSEDGEIGFIDSKPEFDCSISNPIITFANHTCAVRKLSSPFGVIQNVFPLKNRKDTDINYIFQILKGGVEPEGYKGHYPKLRETEFLVPPLPEQKKIASILTSVDEVIEKTQSQIDKLQDLKKGTMNELLTKGIGHTEFKDSELGRIPKSWELARLDDLVSAPICYGIVQVGEFVPDGVPVIAIKNLGNISLSNLNRTSTTIESRYERSRVKPGDLLISIKGTIGRLDIAPTDFAGNISRDIARLRFSEKMLSEFCLGFLDSSNGKRLIERTSVGTTRAELSIHRIKEMSIPVPPITEQHEIISVSKSLSDKIWASENYLTKTQSLKKSLMQDLLTGKVRVSVN